MFNAVFTFLDGKRYKVDGLWGTFKIQSYLARYPYNHEVVRLYHEPDRDQRKYRLKREEMGDDWDTDFTEAIDHYCAIATLLGYGYSGEYTNPQTETATKFLALHPENFSFFRSYMDSTEPELMFRDYIQSLYDTYKSWTVGMYSGWDNVPDEVTNGLWACLVEKFPLDAGYELEEIFETIDYVKMVEKVKEFI